MDTIKARVQGNAVVVTIPKSSGVKPGTEYRFIKEEDGSLKFTPTKKIPDTLEELFKDWHGKYYQPEDLCDWQNEEPKGGEIW